MQSSVNNRRRNDLPASAAWALLLALVVAFLLVPYTNAIFRSVSSEFPYIMGFFKFMLLSSMGELLALRIRSRQWSLPPGFVMRVVVWGIIGVFITFMFSFYSSAVNHLQAIDMLPGQSGGFLTAFQTSVLMNLTFGPAFMIAHRISDSAIELFAGRTKEAARTNRAVTAPNRPAARTGNAAARQPAESGVAQMTGFRAVLANVEWAPFLRVIVFSLFLFWIPVHTLVFMLPVVYRVIAAAMLSIVLGVILALAAGREGGQP